MNTPPSQPPGPPLPPDDDVHAWLVQREALRALHQNVLDEPVPESLLAAANMTARQQAQKALWMRWGGMAAGVLIAFGAGWLANGQWAMQRAGGRLAWAPQAGEFVHAASVAHAVYAPEKRHPVEVAAAEQQHLVQWLSRRLDKPLKVPDLSADGYTLVGGRLLPGEAGARAQFMFEDSAGQRVTLYIGSISGTAASARATESAFRFSTDGPVPSFYWVDQGFGYAIAGKLPRETLMNLAMLTYRQLP